ncbi:hypothetical protein ACFLXM_00325 [Chloroflexota bacterium]
MTKVMGGEYLIEKREDGGYMVRKYCNRALSRGEIMKSIVREATREETGSVFIIVLVLLVVGGLVLTPLLGLMSTGLVSGQVYEKKTDELYAADAGVEDAIWRIQANNLTFGANNSSDPWQLAVNNRAVHVIVYREDLDPTPCGEDFRYQILSTAITHASGGTAAIDSSTTIDAHVAPIVEYYPSIMDHLVTIQGSLTKTEVNDLNQDLAKLEITCPAECTDCAVCGKAYDYYTEYDQIPAECRGCVAVYNFPAAAWPTADYLSARYWEDVKDEVPDPRGNIDLHGVDREEGPLYRDDTLEIVNSSATPATLTLTGTLYITGDTKIGESKGGKDLTLDLNGHTVFVSSTTAKALSIGGQCGVQGPGLIIAVGDINFAPKSVIGGDQNPVFIFSVRGTTTVQPSGAWCGAIAGKQYVEVKSGNEPTTTYPEGGFGDLEFPLIEASRTCSIISWHIGAP